MKEKLSAMLDGELNAAEQEELLKLMNSDRDLFGAWERYQLVGSIIRNELEPPLQGSLADQIAKAIEREPTIISPGALPTRVSRSWFKAAGTAAIAASVAAMAIFSLQTASVKDPLPKGQQVANSESIQGGSEPAKALIKVGETRWSNRQPGMESTLNMYLVEHNEFSPASNLKGMMSYGRVAGYDNDQ